MAKFKFKTSVFAFALLASAATSARAQFPAMPGTWAGGMPMPHPIAEVGATALDGKIHVLGGSVDGRMTLAFHGQYDAATNTWRWRAPLPRELSHVGVAALNHRWSDA